jgi:hypothetical protein
MCLWSSLWRTIFLRTNHLELDIRLGIPVACRLRELHMILSELKIPPNDARNAYQLVVLSCSRLNVLAIVMTAVGLSRVTRPFQRAKEHAKLCYRSLCIQTSSTTNPARVPSAVPCRTNSKCISVLLVIVTRP